MCSSDAISSEFTEQVQYIKQLVHLLEYDFETIQLEVSHDLIGDALCLITSKLDHLGQVLEADQTLEECKKDYLTFYR